MRRVALLFATSAATACLFPSLDELTSAIDGSTDAFGDASNDVDTDAASDALVDSTSEAASGFCSHVDAAFCADFDQSGDPAFGFTNGYYADGGIAALDDATFSSPPASLATGNTALTSLQSAHAAVVKLTGIAPSQSATLDFDIRVDSVATEGTYIEALAVVYESATRSSIQLNIKSVSTEVGEEIVALDGGKTYVAHLFSTPFTIGKWSHVTIATAFGSTRSITVTVDSTTVVDHVPMNAAFLSGAIDLYVGNAYSPGPSSGAFIHYDNVVLQAN